MSLSEIKNKLYKKDPDENLSEHDGNKFDARIDSVGMDKKTEPVIDKKTEPVMDVWIENKNIIPDKQKGGVFKIIGIATGIIAGIALLAVGGYLIRQSSFDERRVTISIEGSQEAKSGKLATYEIIYKNDNWGTLNNVVLRINHPESFKPEESMNYREESSTVSLVDLGSLAGHTTGKIVFGGRTYSPKGTLIYLNAELIYTPKTFKNQFTAKDKLGISIASVPITLEVMAPQSIVSGDALDYQIDYKNIGDEDFENIRVKVDFPNGFNFSKAEPMASEGNNIWYIGHLSAGEVGKITIRGSLQGEKDNIKKITTSIGAINKDQFVVYNKEDTSTSITESPLLIMQKVNGLTTGFNAGAGEFLNFEIVFKNNSNTSLRDVIIKESLIGSALDYSSLKIENGSYDSDSQTIEWKAIDYPVLASLAPGQGGVIRFAIKLKDMLSIQNEGDKNFVVSGTAKIDSPDVPTPIEKNKLIAGNKIDIKLRSKLLLDIQGYYGDALISNSGPIPPTVGRETTYTMHLKAGNVSNDVVNAKIEALLPAGVLMTGKVYPGDAKIEYNERTNTLTWHIGDLKAGEGIINAPREIALQIKIKPAFNQRGKELELVKSAVFSAKDLFTNENLTAQVGVKTTILPEDKSINASGWKVR